MRSPLSRPRARHTSDGQLEFRRHLIKERQHERDATILHKNHIYALDRLLARSSIAPRQASLSGKQIDRPKLAENVVRVSLMQCRDRTIELISPVLLAAMIDEYAIFGPELGDRPLILSCRPRFPEHLVEIAATRVETRRVRCRLSCASSSVLVATRKRAESGAPQLLDEYRQNAQKAAKCLGRGRPCSNRRAANRPACPTIAAAVILSPGEMLAATGKIEPLRREIGREAFIVEARGGRGRVGEPIQ